MHVLVVEDEGHSGAAVAAELTRALSCRVSAVRSPDEALTRLQYDRFDVAVVDMLYRAESTDFEARRRQGRVRLTDQRLHLSGLAILAAARAAETTAVLWTNGDSNRRLHMVYAYERFDCRHLCSKDLVDTLAEAVRAARSGRAHVDPVLRMHLPPRSAPSMQETFFWSQTRSSVWRAMALGLHDHGHIAKSVGVSAGTVRRGMDEMRSRLVAFDPGCSLVGPPTPELIRYASQNWQFFLDHTVREEHP